MKNSKSMIILLVGLALLTLVVVVGLFFFYPKEPAKTTAPATAPGTVSSTPVPDEFDPVEWTRNPSSPSLQTPVATGTGDQGFTVTLPPAEGTGTTSVLPPSPGATFPSDGVPLPSTVTSTPVAPAAAPVSPPPSVPSVKTTPAPAPKAVTAPKPAPTVKTVKVTEYWIQVGSFRDRYQAENTAKSLESQGLKGTLSTATVNGQAVVRVRVGPYTNQEEAKKFLSWLTPVKEFSASYVTKVSATRSAP